MDLHSKAQTLINAQQDIWNAQWALRDTCRAILRGPALDIKALQEETGISSRKILRWAIEAALVPPLQREQDHAPGRQIARARRAEKALLDARRRRLYPSG